jgi:hypothetical protein
MSDHEDNAEYMAGFIDGIKNSGLPQLEIMLRCAEDLELSKPQIQVIQDLIAKRKAGQ